MFIASNEVTWEMHRVFEDWVAEEMKRADLWDNVPSTITRELNLALMGL